MPNTTATPLRYFGKCQVKGCKHRRVLEATSAPELEELNGRLLVRASEGLYGLAFVGDKGQDGALKAAGLGCPAHGGSMVYQGGRFTYNPEKVCNAKCMGAAGPACDCSCGGSNHGGQHL